MGKLRNLHQKFISGIVTYLFFVFMQSLDVSEASSCTNGLGLNYTIPMFHECKEKLHPSGSMVQTIPKLVPYSSNKAACPHKKSKLGIPRGYRVCGFRESAAISVPESVDTPVLSTTDQMSTMTEGSSRRMTLDPTTTLESVAQDAPGSVAKSVSSTTDQKSTEGSSQRMTMDFMTTLGVHPSAQTWDYNDLVARQNTWNHVAMTYDRSALLYYLNGTQQMVTNQNCCTGPILTRNTSVTIGHAGEGKDNEYFYGLIDEVKIFGRVLSAIKVQNMASHPCL